MKLPNKLKIWARGEENTIQTPEENIESLDHERPMGQNHYALFHRVDYQTELIARKINQLIDYLSDKEAKVQDGYSYIPNANKSVSYVLTSNASTQDAILPINYKEASKGECNHHPNFRKDNGDCVMCVLDKPKNHPQQEESRVGCDKCGGLPFKHKEWCSTEPQLKEESPKEDDMKEYIRTDYFLQKYIKANFVSKEKINKEISIVLESEACEYDLAEKLLKKLGLEEL